MERTGETDGRSYGDYVNVPKALAIVISSRLATLDELSTVYGVRDLYDLLEIVAVDSYNQRVASRVED